MWLMLSPSSLNLMSPFFEEVEPDPQHLFKDHFYPPRTSPQSCFDLPPIPKDMTFELNPDYVSMLPKFMRFEDPYLFIREFE